MMTVETITVQQAEALISGGDAILIDVREADEFKAEHIACALSMPLSGLPDLFAQLQIPKGRKIIFQCLKGSRGQQACAALAGLNLAGVEVYNLEGGITAWKDAGLPVIASAGGIKLSIFRQVQIIVGTLVTASVILGFAGLTFAFVLAGLFGAALAIAGITGWCGLAMVLTKMPWNR